MGWKCGRKRTGIGVEKNFACTIEQNIFCSRQRSVTDTTLLKKYEEMSAHDGQLQRWQRKTEHGAIAITAA